LCTSIVIRSGIILFICIYLDYKWVPSVYKIGMATEALCLILFAVAMFLLGTIIYDITAMFY
jgi:hypothetical protein